VKKNFNDCHTVVTSLRDTIRSTVQYQVQYSDFDTVFRAMVFRTPFSLKVCSAQNEIV